MRRHGAVEPLARVSPLRLLALVALAALPTPNEADAHLLQAWLDDLGEGAHADALAAEGFTTVEELISTGLDEKDLAELGLGLKSRRRVAKALRSFAQPAADAAPDRKQQSHDAPLVREKKGGKRAAAAAGGSEGTWPTPSALRRFVDPGDVHPPGKGSGTWNTSGVVHPGAAHVTQISSDPRLEQWDGFFSDEEVDVLLDALTVGSGKDGSPDSWMGAWQHHNYRYSASGEAKLNLKYLHPSLGDSTRSEASSVLMRAEERVAAWTGVAWKDFTGFQVRDEWEHILNPSLSPSAIAAIPPCSPVHVDNHKAPARVSTSIIYLTTLDSGATVFPCILPEGTKKSVVKQRRKHCMDAAQRGAVTNYDHTHGDPYGLLGLAGAVCNGTEPGVAVMPKAGRAVMFYAKDKAVPNFLLWHAGCHLFAPPLAGGGDGAAAQEGQGKTQGPKERKITIQKFKEAAPIVRYDKSKPSAKHMLTDEFGKEWLKVNANRDDGVTAEELAQQWLDALQVQQDEKSGESGGGGGGWFGGGGGAGVDVDRAGLDAQTERLVAELDVDKDGKVGLVEWTVQHSLIEGYLLSRRFASASDA